MIAEQDKVKLDALLYELADFALENDNGKCFPDWTRESVKNFLHLHLNQKTLVFVRAKEELVGLVTWWRWEKDELPDMEGDEIFTNPPPCRSDGNLIYISDVVATVPNVMKVTGKEITRRNPDYAECEIWGTRESRKTGEVRRVQYSKRLLDLINIKD